LALGGLQNDLLDDGAHLNVKQVQVGLSTSLDDLRTKIAKRVEERFTHGAVDEVEALHHQFGDRQLPAWSTLGVKEIKAYLDGKISAEECMRLWTLHEVQYAKRQLTWLKREIPGLHPYHYTLTNAV